MNGNLFKKQNTKLKGVKNKRKRESCGVSAFWFGNERFTGKLTGVTLLKD